ncbi:hypothetical protein [uncultured Sphingorhabdus sp.]|uniref:hypothetical protein n=1 Tax=uncultured Sphingorhabdus sp. TaxID=1686106 RepID=UPI00262D39A2|nr:hypothetical protein [uncultured Sphingorhabdus sp.]
MLDNLRKSGYGSKRGSQFMHDLLHALTTLTAPLFIQGISFWLLGQLWPTHHATIATEAACHRIEKRRSAYPPIAIYQSAPPQPHSRIFERHALTKSGCAIGVWAWAIVIGCPRYIDTRYRTSRYVVSPDDRSIIIGFKAEFIRGQNRIFGKFITEWQPRRIPCFAIFAPLFNPAN